MSDIDDFQRSQARSRRMRFAILGLVLSSPFLWLGWNCHKRNAQNDAWREEQRKRNELSAADKTQLDKLMTETRVRLQAGIKAFPVEAAPAKLEALVPGDDPCPASVRSLDPAADAYLDYGLSVQTVKPGVMPKAEDLASDVGTLDRISEDMRKDEDGPNLEHLDRVRELSNHGGYEVFLVGEKTDAIVLANEYVPGRARGTVYVYSAAAQRIVCAADVDVENASEVSVEYRTSNYDVTGETSKREATAAKLIRDLGVRLRKAIRANLRALR